MGSLTDKYQQLRKETEEKQRIEQEMQKQEAYYGNIINRTKFVCKEHWKEEYKKKVRYGFLKLKSYSDIELFVTEVIGVDLTLPRIIS